MLKLTIPEMELYDEEKAEFSTSKERILTLEHSLVSISKWEAKWHIPFLSKTEKTNEQSMDYIRCMIVSPKANNDDNVLSGITNDLILETQKYIGAPMTATTIKKSNSGSVINIITSEIIYYQMIAHNIPFDCQKWHLNRLLMLISVCNDKNAPKKKTSKSEMMHRNRSLNASRKKAIGSKG